MSKPVLSKSPSVQKIRQWLQCLVLVGLVPLVACNARQSLGIDGDQQQKKLTQVMVDAGYLQEGSAEADSREAVWQYGNVAIETLLTVPKAPGSYPLILYLPSLGEHASAGQVWRDAWVKSGYAVLSLQSAAIADALKELNAQQLNAEEQDDNEDRDETDPVDANHGWVGSLLGQSAPKRSGVGRASELRYLGHQYFSVDALKERVAQLNWVYQQIQLQQASGQLKKIDLSRVILAGYDLGAQTVAVFAGEKTDPALTVNPSFKPVAAIAISPSVNLATGQVNSRFKPVSVPLLVVTGTEDSDPYAVSVASSRTLLWEYAAAGNKYLLLLNKARHRVLSGAEFGGRTAPRRAAETELFGQNGSKRQLTAEQHSAGLGGLWPDSGRQNPDLGYKHVAAVASVSAAFLDTIVKNDDFARFWLTDKAAGWLKQAGELRLR